MNKGRQCAQPLITVEGVHTYYGKSHILDGVSLKVGKGEVVGLLGRNGVGKSTTLKAIMGLVHPSLGTVLLEDRPISNLPADRLARLGIGYVPEKLEPRIILLDEPTEGLMPRMVSHIQQIIEALHDEGVAILLVGQNVPLTLEVSRRIYFMEKGMVRHHAPASELQVSDAVIRQYLGV
jgi:ABC-type branched-subunit amino acid transport system ATPase component